MSTEFRLDFVEIPHGLTIRANGVAVGRVRALRAGVQIYYENGRQVRELRTIEEVKRVAPYLKAIPNVINHPPGNLITKKNIDRLSKGLSGQGEFISGWVEVDICIDNLEAVQKITTTHQQVSMGYFVHRIPQSGVWVDELGVMGVKGREYEYDRIATYKIPHDIFGESATENDIFNHLAFVSNARAGEDATFVSDENNYDLVSAVDLRLDSNENSFTIRKEKMENIILVADGNSIAIPGDAAPLVKKLLRAVRDLRDTTGYQGDSIEVSTGGVTHHIPVDAEDMVGKNTKMLSDLASAMKDIADASNYKGKMVEQSIDSAKYKLPESMRDMVKHISDMMTDMKNEIDEKGNRADRAAKTAENLRHRLDELESQKLATVDHQEVIKTATSLIDDYNKGKPYYDVNSQPSLQNAAQDMTEYKRGAIKNHCSTRIDAQEIERVGWDANTITSWTSEEVEREFANLLRFYPAENNDAGTKTRQDHAAIVAKWNGKNRPVPTQKQPAKQSIFVGRRAQDMKI